MSELQAFAEHIREQIPLTRHLDFQLLGWDGQQLRLSAGLAVNVNDKGTLFAGSQTALLTLAGWAYTTLLARPEPVDVLAANSNMAFRAPIRGDMEILAEASEADRQRFGQRLDRKGRAPLTVLVRAREQGGDWASEFSGSYLASRHPGKVL